MIERGSKITLESFTNTETNGKRFTDAFGEFSKFRATDTNKVYAKKPSKQFYHLNIYSNSADVLQVGDEITVDRILYIRYKFVKGYNTLEVGVSIKEKYPYELPYAKERAFDYE